jgi:hypothetical protein
MKRRKLPREMMARRRRRDPREEERAMVCFSAFVVTDL